MDSAELVDRLVALPLGTVISSVCEKNDFLEKSFIKFYKYKNSLKVSVEFVIFGVCSILEQSEVKLGL